MLLAAYKGTRPGAQGIANRIIRLRLGGPYSHVEVAFEPGDGVDELLPDGSAAPDADGALWAASSVAAERMPDHSFRRAGEIGGVRFKRIVFDPDRWDLVRVPADATVAVAYAIAQEGALYDWSLIAKFVAWIVPEDPGRLTCSEFAAAALQFPEPWRFDPCNLTAAARRLAMGG